MDYVYHFYRFSSVPGFYGYARRVISIFKKLSKIRLWPIPGWVTVMLVKVPPNSSHANVDLITEMPMSEY